MTREKMMELWHKEFENSYTNWGFTPQLYEYLDGKTDKLDDKCQKGNKYYSYYDEWMVKELDGENAELARRMLTAVSKFRYGGICSTSYMVENDAKICLRIGYGFDDILKHGIMRHGTNLDVITIYKVAELLMTYQPAQSEAFADLLLTDKLNDWKPQNADFALALYLAVILLRTDANKYQRYVPALVKAASKGGNYVTAMLYYAYPYSPQLKEVILQKIQTDTSTIKFIHNVILRSADMRPFLQEIGAPLWPYYYIIATYHKPENPGILQKLYAEDKDVFMDTYKHLIVAPASGDGVYGLYLHAILQKNGEGREFMDRTDKGILYAMIHLLDVSCNSNQASKKITEEQINDPSMTTEDWKKILDRLHFFGRGISSLATGGLGVLYEYCPLAKRFIDVLLIQPNSLESSGNVSLAVSKILEARKKWLGISPRDSLQMLLNADNSFTIKQAFKAYSAYPDKIADALTKEDIEQNKQEALELLTDGSLSIEETLQWIDFVYNVCGFDDYKPLIGLLANKSKVVRKQAEATIADKEEGVRPLLESQFGKLKKDAQAAAKRLLKRWDNERKFGADFTFTNATVVEYCTDNYDPAYTKFISWIPEDMLMDVRFADLTEKAPKIVIQYILSEYLSLEEPYKIKACDMIVPMLNPQDFQAALENIYQYWKDNDADSKKKMIMVPYCIYASDSQILKLKTQLKEWAENSRGALAAYVVNAIAMNGGNVALMMIDSMAVKFPINQIKNAAKAAFSFAAKALEVPEDVLSDKIVPTLGFSKEGEKILDYGPRNFTVTLMPDFSLSIFDNEKQKAIKSMPAPGANDDTVKATAAKKEFSELKKQIKATVQAQTYRLEKVLMNGRTWNADAWTELFVENPIMHHFAMGLIWGVYEDNRLKATFRYMEDGTFNTVDEEEYTLPEKAAITLVHPIELPEETLAQWKEQLDDYEIVQPLPQLTLPAITLQEKELSEKKVIRYQGCVAPAGKIAGLAKKYSMVRGDVLDAGCYTAFHLVDKYLNVAALLSFDNMFMGQEYNENVTLEDVVFYRLDEDQAVDDEPKNSALVAPDALPPRFVSSVIGAFDTLKE